MAQGILNNEEIATRLQTLSGWALHENRMVKTFQFADFQQAFGWMTQVAEEAETLKHHPNWTNVYNRVDVVLWTHDADGITHLDIELAQRMNALQ